MCVCVVCEVWVNILMCIYAPPPQKRNAKNEMEEMEYFPLFFCISANTDAKSNEPVQKCADIGSGDDRGACIPLSVTDNIDK